MAQKLKIFDWSRASALTTADKATYPWDEWLDGDIWKLVEGEDFVPHPLMMERIIRTRATGRHAKVRLRHLPAEGNGGEPFGIIVLQRTDVKGPADLRKDEQRKKRAIKKAQAEIDAEATLEAAGIKATRSKTPAKATAKKTAAKKSATKRPVKRLAVVS